MEEKLYELMDWREIEAVVYSEEKNPGKILGPKVTEDGILIQCFFPGKDAVRIRAGRKIYEMVQEDEAGYFAVLIPGKRIPD